MDFVRGICILLVIFVHATVATSDWGKLTVLNGITYFNEFLDPFRMPLLMFLSGMLLHKSLGKSTSNYIWGKFHLVFWPFLIWSMVIYAAEGRLTLEFILKTPISAPSVLWYLWFLCAYYIVALVLTRYSVPLLPVIIICVIGSAFLPSLLRIDRFVALFAFFLLGHYVTKYDLASWISAPIGVLGLVATVIGGVISATGEHIKYDPMFVWVPLGLIVFVLWGATFYKTIRISKPFEWIGRNSIVFYVSHFPALVIASRLISPVVEWNGSIFYVLLILWAVAVGTVLQLVRARFSIFAALFDFRQVLKILNIRQGPSPLAPAK